MTMQGPPPPENVGAVRRWVRWARENLFSSVFNSILTVVSIAVGVVVIRGLISFVFAPGRRWYVIPPNMKLYMSDVYPIQSMGRLWASLAIVMILTGLSLAVWRAGGRLTPNQLSRVLSGIGVSLVLLAAVTSMPAVVRMWVAGFGLAFLLASTAVKWLWSGNTEAEVVSLMAMLLGAMVAVLVVVWILPVAGGTKVSVSVQAGLLVAAYLIGILLRKYVPVGVTKGSLVALWILSLPFIYLVIQRDPDLAAVPVTTMVIPFAAGFAVVGAAYMWWAGSPHEGEAPKVVSALLVIASIAIWFTPLAMLPRFLLLALTVFGLAASTFGGTERGRNGLLIGWIAADLLVSYFMAVSMGSTGIPILGGFIGGLNLTFLLALAGIALAFPFGILLALGRTSSMPIFRLLSTGYIEVIRGVPMITMLFFGALVINRFLPADVSLNIIVAVTIAIGMFAAAYLAENVRGGLQSIPKGQREAAQAVGLTTVQMTVLITLPQALRAVIPAIVGQVITMFKDTSLVSIVGLADFLRIARYVVPGQTQSLGSLQESLLFASIVYWIFSFGTSRASMRLEKKLGVGER
jgi:His/Glu/Gln/Arg/opine family amino acid ABC transporter permease subunit